MLGIIRMGFPPFIEQTVIQEGFLILEMIIVSMGMVAVTAYQVGINMNS
jgi:Na+-driven multidrug efflux pump